MSKLYFHYGAMGSSKSLQLMAAAYNYTERGLNPLLLTFAGDNRFGVGKIASRAGLEMPALVYNNETDMEHGLNYDDVDAIFVDEAQFLNQRQVEELHSVTINLGIPVLCYGLRTDFLGNLFEGSSALLAHAETIKEIKTICSCGKKATHNLRYSNGEVCTKGDVVQIGDAEYKSVCFSCFRKEHLRT